MFQPSSFRLFCGPLLLLIAAAGCQQFASQGLNVEGTRLHQQGNYDAARGRFEQAIANDPNNADGYYNLAATYHRMAKLNGREADYQQAENLYNQCLDRDPNHIDCYRGLAVLLTETGRSDKALKLMEYWATKSPTLADPKIEMARLLEEFGDRETAKTRLVEALASEPNNARALTALGKLREESGETAQALQDYQRSLTINRFQPDVATRVAALQSALGGARPLAPAADTRLVNQRTELQRY